MKNEQVKGHLAAFVTIFIWGTTFISTKILLADFQPVEILLLRFLLGFAVLLIVYPRFLRGTDWRQELTFFAAGLSGICLYYLLENIALTYTLASNVGVIISIAPCFTVLVGRLFQKGEEKPRGNFFLGFAVAMVGICLIGFGGFKLKLNPIGDLLAVAAAFVWACYSVLTKKISSFGYSTILTTRRVFFYGLLCMVPTLFFFDVHWEFSRFQNPASLLHLLFLGLFASALCFGTWNFAVKVLGAVRTSVYIYMVPVITVVTSALVLGERLTVPAGIGTLLTLAGLVVSEQKLTRKRGK